MKSVKYIDSDKNQENISKVDTNTILRKWSLKAFQELKKTAVAN